jgi:hypothetical protein
MMTNAVPTHADTFSRPQASIDGFIKPMFEHALVWMHTCADYWAAAATYEQLSRLSDAGLNRRGLSRMNLARDICTSFENARNR